VAGLMHPEPEQILESAMTALSTEEDWRTILDALPAPVYTTDVKGGVTYWNAACAKFAGREPEIGSDRWCVTWRLYTTIGEPLKHEDCPMAQAIKEQIAVRDAIAIAERPDGTRVAFRPYPTPLFDEDGSFKGAVNVLIDVTEEQSEALHEQAERCRRFANALYSRESSEVLNGMAERFEQSASELGQKRAARGA
jgi:PAS domain S-box-containing protein